MDKMFFDNLPPIINNISDIEINENKNFKWLENIGEKIDFEKMDNLEITQNFSEQDIYLLENIDVDENPYEIPDEIFFSSKENCTTFFGVFINANTRSAVFLTSNVINPYSVYNGELHACGTAMVYY